MKSFKHMISLVVIAAAVSAPAQTDSSIEVSRSAICPEIVDREPVNADSVFDASVETLYCFTELDGPEGNIVHAWYQGDSLRAEVHLNKASEGRWRTWSSKVMPAYWQGEWHVEVRDSEGALLKNLSFVYGGPED